MEDFDSLTVPKLRDECTKRNIDSKGVKAVLISRLKDHVASSEAEASTTSEAPQQGMCVPGSETAAWRTGCWFECHMHHVYIIFVDTYSCCTSDRQHDATPSHSHPPPSPPKPTFSSASRSLGPLSLEAFQVRQRRVPQRRL